MNNFLFLIFKFDSTLILKNYQFCKNFSGNEKELYDYLYKLNRSYLKNDDFNICKLEYLKPKSIFYKYLPYQKNSKLKKYFCCFALKI